MLPELVLGLRLLLLERRRQLFSRLCLRDAGTRRRQWRIVALVDVRTGENAIGMIIVIMIFGMEGE